MKGTSVFTSNIDVYFTKIELYMSEEKKYYDVYNEAMKNSTFSANFPSQALIVDRLF